MRPSKRPADAMREVSLTTGVNRHAEGSCLVKFGETHVLCLASLEERVPPFPSLRLARSPKKYARNGCVDYR